MKLVAQRGHLIQMRHVSLGIDIAHQGDVEGVAQVTERLARPDLAAGVRRVDERLREEQHFETMRAIS
jgi:hypothetical protein